VDYDYLVIATGPKLNFAGTPGLGPETGNSFSICTLDHTIQARDEYLKMVERMQKGDTVKIVVGTGHPAATCQGAAFEYITNIHKDLLRRGVRDKAKLMWISNEPRLGDFGIRGVTVRKNGKPFTRKETKVPRNLILLFYYPSFWVQIFRWWVRTERMFLKKLKTKVDLF